MSDIQRLKDIQQRHEKAPTNWVADFYDEECQLKAYPPVSMRNLSTQETYASLQLNDYDAIQMLLNAHADIEFLLSLVKRAVAKIKRLEGNFNQPINPAKEHSRFDKNYAANCAMLCAEPAFKKFLKTHHGLGLASDKRTAAKVRELLGIASRKQLNSSQDKANLWLKLTKDFENWKRHG